MGIIKFVCVSVRFEGTLMKNEERWGLERWLGSWKNLLLFQRRFQWNRLEGSPSLVLLVSGDLVPFSGLQEHLDTMWHIFTQTLMHIYEREEGGIPSLSIVHDLDYSGLG